MAANLRINVTARANVAPMVGALRQIQAASNQTMATMRTDAIRVESPIARLNASLSKGTLTFRQFRDVIRNSNAILRENNALLRAKAISHRDAAGNARVHLLINRDLSATYATLTQRLALNISMTMGLASRMITLGKNIQWAGRQVMVGFTLPFLMAATALGRGADELDRQMTRIKKVMNLENIGKYNPAGEFLRSFNIDNKREMDLAMKSIDRQTDKILRLGAANGFTAQQTAGVVSELAQMGFTGYLLDGVTESALRLSRVSGAELTEAVNLARIGVEAFGLSVMQLPDSFQEYFPDDIDPDGFTDSLMETIARLNLIENRTSLTLAEMASSLPVVAGVAKNLGINMETLAGMIALIKTQGVPAQEAANSMRTGLIRLVQDATIPSIDAFNKLGINIKSIQEENLGNVMGTLVDLSGQLYNIKNSGEGAAAAQDLFVGAMGKMVGSRQAARFTNLLEGMTDQLQKNEDGTISFVDNVDKTSLAYRALAPAIEQSNYAMQQFRFEEEMIANSLAGQADIIKGKLTVELRELGRVVLQVKIRLMELGLAIVRWFNNLSEGTKRVMGMTAAILGLLGPVTMFIGLFANLMGQLTKFLLLPIAGFFKLIGKSFQVVTSRIMAEKLAYDANALAMGQKIAANQALIGSNAAATASTSALTAAMIAQNAAFAGGSSATASGAAIARGTPAAAARVSRRVRATRSGGVSVGTTPVMTQAALAQRASGPVRNARGQFAKRATVPGISQYQAAYAALAAPALLSVLPGADVEGLKRRMPGGTSLLRQLRVQAATDMAAAYQKAGGAATGMGVQEWVTKNWTRDAALLSIAAASDPAQIAMRGGKGAAAGVAVPQLLRELTGTAPRIGKGDAYILSREMRKVMRDQFGLSLGRKAVVGTHVSGDAARFLSEQLASGRAGVSGRLKPMTQADMTSKRFAYATQQAKLERLQDPSRFAAPTGKERAALVRQRRDELLRETLPQDRKGRIVDPTSRRGRYIMQRDQFRRVRAGEELAATRGQQAFMGGRAAGTAMLMAPFTILRKIFDAFKSALRVAVKSLLFFATAVRALVGGVMGLITGKGFMAGAAPAVAILAGQLMALKAKFAALGLAASKTTASLLARSKAGLAAAATQTGILPAFRTGRSGARTAAGFAGGGLRGGAIGMAFGIKEFFKALGKGFVAFGKGSLVKGTFKAMGMLFFKSIGSAILATAGLMLSAFGAVVVAIMAAFALANPQRFFDGLKETLLPGVEQVKSAVEDLVSAWRRLVNSIKTAREQGEGFAGSVANLFGQIIGRIGRLVMVLSVIAVKGLQTLLDVINIVVRVLQGDFSGAMDIVRMMFLKSVAFIMNILDPIIQWFKSKFSLESSGAMRSFMDTAVRVFMTVYMVTKAVLKGIVNDVRKMWDGIKTSFALFIEMGRLLVGALVAIVMGLGNAAKIALDLIKPAFEVVAESIKKLKESAIKAFDSIKESFSSWYEQFKPLVEELFDWMAEKFDSLMERARPLLETLKEFIFVIDQEGEIDWLSSLFTTAGADVIRSVKDSVKEIWQSTAGISSDSERSVGWWDRIRGRVNESADLSQRFLDIEVQINAELGESNKQLSSMNDEMKELIDDSKTFVEFNFIQQEWIDKTIEATRTRIDMTQEELDLSRENVKTMYRELAAMTTLTDEQKERIAARILLGDIETRQQEVISELQLLQTQYADMRREGQQALNRVIVDEVRLQEKNALLASATAAAQAGRAHEAFRLFEQADRIKTTLTAEQGITRRLAELEQKRVKLGEERAQLLEKINKLMGLYSQERRNQEQTDFSIDDDDAEESVNDFVNAFRSAMNEIMGDIRSTVSKIIDMQMKAIQDHFEAIGKATEEYFRRFNENLNNQLSAIVDQLEQRARAEEDAINKVADARIDAIEEEKKKEQELERLRQEFFRREQARLDFVRRRRVANVEIQEARLRGDLGRAAVLQIERQFAIEEYFQQLLQDREAEILRLREEARDQEIEAIEEERSAALKANNERLALSKVVLDEMKRLAEEAAEVANQRAVEEIEAAELAQEKAREAEQARINDYLREWSRITPATEDELKRHNKALQDFMNESGRRLRNEINSIEANLRNNLSRISRDLQATNNAFVSDMSDRFSALEQQYLGVNNSILSAISEMTVEVGNRVEDMIANVGDSSTEIEMSLGAARDRFAESITGMMSELEIGAGSTLTAIVFDLVPDFVNGLDKGFTSASTLIRTFMDDFLYDFADGFARARDLAIKELTEKAKWDAAAAAIAASLKQATSGTGGSTGGGTNNPPPATEPPPASTIPILREGMRSTGPGWTVQSLQKTLNQRGWRDDAGNLLVEDGVFGRLTRQAVERLQKALPRYFAGQLGTVTDKEWGALMPSMHTGGLVTGRMGDSSGRSLKNDEVATILQKGEYVLRRNAVKALGVDFLEKINSAQARFTSPTTASLSVRNPAASGGSSYSNTYNLSFQVDGGNIDEQKLAQKVVFEIKKMERNAGMGRRI